MSRLYRMLALIDVDAVLPENEQDFWKDVLARCTERPAEVLDGTETECPETAEQGFTEQIGIITVAYYSTKKIELPPAETEREKRARIASLRNRGHWEPNWVGSLQRTSNHETI